jgi:hypothetical protein
MTWACIDTFSLTALFFGTKRFGRALGSVLSEVGTKKMYSDMAESNPRSKVRRHIDENLRRIYDETLNEQIPEKLTRLLEQLHRRTAPNAEDGDPEDRS